MKTIAATNERARQTLREMQKHASSGYVFQVSDDGKEKVVAVADDDGLPIDDDGKRKHAISTVVAAYKDEDIDNDLIENDYGDDAIYPSVMGAFELTASMRKLLNMVTNYKHRDYFDSISPVQALVHLVNDNYEPHDIEF